jgi:invasion protein IalB
VKLMAIERLKFLLPAGFLLLATNMVMAEPVSMPPGDQVFGSWRIKCPTINAMHQCQMIQAVSLSKGDAIPFLLSIMARSDERARYAVITVPIGVYLSNGVEIVVDQGRPFKVLFEVCDQRGCYAGFKLDDPVLSAFMAGQTARFRVWTAKAQAVDFPVSLSGFTAGWRAFQKVVTE